MAELADAPDLGSGVYDVQVQVLLSALTVLGRHSDSGMSNSHGFALRLRLKQKP